MPEVDLTIIANNQEFMKTMNESRKAEGDFYADWQKNMTDTADQHEDIMKGMQDELKRLGISEEEFLKKYKQVSEGQMGILEQLNDDLRTFKRLKESATTTQDIEKFNKKINETQKQIDELGKKGVKSTDSFDKLKGGFIKLFGVIGGGYAIIQGAKKLIESTGDSADSFKKKLYVASAGVSFFLKSLVSGDLKNFGARLDEVIRTTSNYFDVLNRLQNLRRSMEVQESKNNITIQAQLQISDDVNKSYFDRIRALVTVNRLEKENAAERIKLAEEQKKNLIPVIQSLTGLTEQQIGYYVEEYKNIENIIEVGNKYNDLLKRRGMLEEAGKAGGGLAGIVDPRLKSALKDVNEQILDMGKFGEFSGKLTIKYGKQTAEEWDNLKNVYIEYNKAVASGDEATRVSERRLNALIKQNEEERLRKKKETDDKIAKQHAEFLKLLEDLQKRYQEAQLDTLTGKERITAETLFQLKEIELLKNNLKAKGKLTKEEYEMIEFLKTSIIEKGNKERKKLDDEENNRIKENAKQKIAMDRGVVDLMYRNKIDEIDLSKSAEDEKLQQKIKATKDAIGMLSAANDDETRAARAALRKTLDSLESEVEEKEFKFDLGEKIFKAMGIDPESPQAKWMGEWTNSVIGSIGSILESEAQLAQQRQQNAENRISELESQLDEELSLQEQGLANNVNAVKKEIEQVKQEKQKAQEQEKQLQAAQMALDTVTQVSSLITASANIFKAFSKIPIIGVPLAWAAIASMFGLMTVAKIKAAQSAKMEQGGYIDEYGVIQGKRHSDGGEPLTKHVEVEQGEGVGVFNRNATQYYGGMLPKWVQSINNKKFPKFDIRPEIKANQIFDLKTSSMNSELKAIRTGIDNLNSNILSQTQTNHKQGVRIEKQGNRTRIVHEKN